jgi:DNA-binding NarL/FixJ family response regulator
MAHDSIPPELAATIRRELTTRQADCLLAALEGHGTRRIARDLGLAKATVAEHLQAARRRLRELELPGLDDADGQPA